MIEIIFIVLLAALGLLFLVLWLKGRKQPPKTIYVEKDIGAEKKAEWDQRAAKQATELALQKERALRSLDQEIATARQIQMEAILSERKIHENETLLLYKSREDNLLSQLQSKKDQIESQMGALDSLLKNKQLTMEQTIAEIESQITI